MNRRARRLQVAFCISLFAFSLLPFAFGVVLITASQATTPARQTPQSSGAQGQSAQLAQLETLRQYCVACHNDRAKVAGVSFEGITPESIGQHADLFEK